MAGRQLQTFAPKIEGSIPADVSRHLQLIYSKLTNHAQAFVALKTTPTTENTTIVENITQGAGGTTPGTSSVFGAVNDQAGQTAYTTQPTDSGSLIILNDASAIAVSLNTGVSAPWMAFFANQGTGTATFTPTAGNISYAGNPAVASMPLLGGYCCAVGFDGADFWAWTEPIVPVTFGAVTHQFLTAYNAATGQFTAAQPTVADVSGAAPLASPTFTGTVTQPDATVLTAATTTTSATAGAATALPATPAGYLSVSLNGTTYKVPFYAV